MKLETFFEKFEVLAEMPGAVGKLREFVVQLAIDGKLVANDPAEPAVTLNLSGASSASIPRPLNWREGIVGDIFTFEYGDNLPAPKRTQSGQYPVYGSNGVVGTHNSYLTKEPAIIVGRKGSAGALNVAAGPSWTTDVAYFVRPPNEIDLRFTFYLFSTLRLTELGKGIKPGLSRNEAYAIPIAIPPFAEQKRIVAKVDELMALCDRLEAQQKERETRHTALARASLTEFADAPTRANLQYLFHSSYSITPAELRKSIYQAAFDGALTGHSRVAASPGAIPTGWVQRDIASLCLIEDGDRGSAYPKKTDFSEGGHCIFLNTKNVRRHGFDFTTLEWISEQKHQQLRKGALIRGDIIFTSRGTIGNVAHYDDSVPFDVLRINSGMFILRGFQQHMDASFLSRLLRSPQIRTQIDSLQSGSAQPQLPIREFRKFTAKTPPLAEQRRIVAKVEQLMALVDALEAQLASSRSKGANLLASLLAEHDLEA